jgi:nucleoside-diphosphate-sugar epimerase
MTRSDERASTSPGTSASERAQADAGPSAFITGLASFTGRYMAQRLRADGYRIAGTVQPGTAAPGIAERAYSADLLDPAALEAALDAVQPAVVVHLAAITQVTHEDVAQTYLVNVVGTRNLLAALARRPRPPRAVLLASSANVYGNTDADLLDETLPPRPANDYAISKLAMEHVARLWRDALPLVIARPFNYTGVGQRDGFLLPKIVDHYARGARTIALGNLDVERDFSDVRDVVEAYARLLAAAPRGETFNVCSGTGRTLHEVLDTLAGIAGYAIDVQVDPRLVRANEVRRLVGSDARLTHVLGARARIPLEDTLRWMYRAARSRYAS